MQHATPKPNYRTRIVAKSSKGNAVRIHKKTNRWESSLMDNCEKLTISLEAAQRWPHSTKVLVKALRISVQGAQA